jgi:hypothetical protein
LPKDTRKTQRPGAEQHCKERGYGRFPPAPEQEPGGSVDGPGLNGLVTNPTFQVVRQLVDRRLAAREPRA